MAEERNPRRKVPDLLDLLDRNKRHSSLQAPTSPRSPVRREHLDRRRRFSDAVDVPADPATGNTKARGKPKALNAKASTNWNPEPSAPPGPTSPPQPDTDNPNFIPIDNPNLIPIDKPNLIPLDKPNLIPLDDNPNLIPIGPRRRLDSEPASISKNKKKKLKKAAAEARVAEEKDDLSCYSASDMAPTPSAPLLANPNGHPGPHPSFIELAKPYVFQHKLDHCLSAIGMNEAREDSVRLQGVQLIDNVRRSLQLPVRTFNTAVVYYHKFRLVHPDHEYSWMDAALSALFTACKIEDTLKKSREIICASINLKLPPSEQLTVDDPQFEAPSKVIIGLERLMLEGAGFDFRNRHPQKLVIKLARNCGFAKDRVGKTAYQMALDLYRTFAPLKQTTPTMAIACVELAARLCEAEMSRVRGETGIALQRWNVSRAEVMETMLDLLDLYTHHRPSTLIGPFFHLDAYISVRITLNQEATASSLPRYTASLPPASTTSTLPTAPSPSTPTNGHPPTTTATAATTTTTTTTTSTCTNKPANGAGPAPRPSSIQSPASELGTPGGAAAGTGRLGGTVRFMLDAARARGEKEVVGGFFRDVEEEFEVEVEVEVGGEREERERERGDEREREREDERERERGDERERERERGDERERRDERGGERGSERGRERGTERDGRRERERERERARERERERERDGGRKVESRGR